MSNIILIHGAWHGAWCWYKLTPLLEQHGYTVHAIDLPGHSKSDSNHEPVTLNDYIHFVKEIMMQQSDRVCLVGHSMAGIILSQLAELLPNKVSHLIYISGFLLNDGQTLLEITKSDKEGLVLPNLIYSRDKKTALVKESVLRDAFYYDCSKEDVELAKSKLVAQSLAPLNTPVQVTQKNWGSVPRSYIECTEDRAVTLDIQRLMVERSPCDIVCSMNTSHSPFLSKPEELAEHIDLICK